MTIYTKKQARELLNVNENASEKEINAAFRKESVKYHPDTSKNPDSEKMGDLTHARDLLLEKAKEDPFCVLSPKDQIQTYASSIFDQESSLDTIFYKLNKLINCGVHPYKYYYPVSVGQNKNIKIYGLTYFDIAELGNITLNSHVESFLTQHGASKEHSMAYHFVLKNAVREMDYELKVQNISLYEECINKYISVFSYIDTLNICNSYRNFAAYTYKKESTTINHIFPSSIELTAREDGNLDFEVLSTKAKVIIQGNRLTADSLLKALTKSNTQAPKGFNGLDYLMANKDLFDHLVDPIKHYVEHGAREHRFPSNFFNEHKYLELHPDIKPAIDNGWLASGFMHFVDHGCKEGRSPDGVYNEKKYAEANSDIHHLKMTGQMECAYFHCIDHGIFEHRDECAQIFA